MAQLLVRNVDDDVAARLKERARRNGRSMEEEVRHILRDAAKSSRRGSARLGSRIASRFAEHGLTQDLPELRGEPARPAKFES